MFTCTCTCILYMEYFLNVSHLRTNILWMIIEFIRKSNCFFLNPSLNFFTSDFLFMSSEGTLQTTVAMNTSTSTYTSIWCFHTCPDTISNIKQPKPHQSGANVYLWPSITSGAKGKKRERKCKYEKDRERSLCEYICTRISLYIIYLHVHTCTFICRCIHIPLLCTHVTSYPYPPPFMLTHVSRSTHSSPDWLSLWYHHS